MELLEIEKDLSGPDAEAALARYDAVLLGLQRRVEEAVRKGLPPGDYAKTEGLADAVVVARKLLRLQMKKA